MLRQYRRPQPGHSFNAAPYDQASKASIDAPRVQRRKRQLLANQVGSDC